MYANYKDMETDRQFGRKCIFFCHFTQILLSLIYANEPQIIHVSAVKLYAIFYHSFGASGTIHIYFGGLENYIF